MATIVRTRTDPRSEATRVALIEAAESLFARHGFDAVSLRQIGAAIGSGNTRVVAYHFGTKDDFIDAIYRHRVPEMEARRRELLAKADAAGRGEDLETLSRIISQPLFEQKDADGQHSYGRFLCTMMLRDRGPSPMMLTTPSPATLTIWGRIQEQLPVKGPVLLMRLHIVIAMLHDAFRLMDNVRGPQFAGFSEERIFEDTIAMTLAAIQTPLS